MDKQTPQSLQELDQQIISENPSLKNIKPKQRQELLEAFVGVSVTKTHAGPLPDVQTLRGYSDIIPNGAERLMQQVEKEGKHRREIEKSLVFWNNIQSLLGQIFGFAIAGGILWASYDLAKNGHYTIAGILGGTTLVSLVSVFVYGKRTQKENNLHK